MHTCKHTHAPELLPSRLYVGRFDSVDIDSNIPRATDMQPQQKNMYSEPGPIHPPKVTDRKDTS